MNERLTRLLGARPLGFEEPPGGHTRAIRGLVRLDSGDRVFVKMADDKRTATALRSEHHVYSSITAEWLPRLVAWEDGDEPLLVLEDLSASRWPPPWPEDVALLLRTLSEVGATPLEVEPMQPLTSSPWTGIMKNPQPVAALGVVDIEWISDHGPALVERSSAIDLTGSDLIHADLGAENLCFTDRGPVIVDWEFTARGNRYLDVATTMLDYRLAGGIPPRDALPNRGAWAALLAGFMGDQASQPPPPWAADGPYLRSLQRSLFREAIDWTQAELRI